ncbi:hypothetical protein Plec18167_001169 [Paecilomyces lecythidis]|uniref:Major facilitator superfamily (MFS) profile domain-containing protein n=1 Tax=Paecilomyces lecythidis TaxID=3004212 RepID=A0ABR3YC55_9EURO
MESTIEALPKRPPSDSSDKQPAFEVTQAEDKNLRDDPVAKAEFLSSFTAEEEKRIMKKVDARFLILTGLMYMIKTIDYTNASSVKVLQVGSDRNILKELHMTADQYNWIQSIYFISYIIFEAPSNLVMKKVGPRVWQTRIFCSWGIVLACHAAVQNRAALYAVRFLLGLLEAGMFPGIAVQFASWYRPDEMGRPIAWIFAIQQLATVVGSLICYGISYMNGMRGLSAWRWVYLLEGLATILFSAVVWLVLPDYPKSPRSNKWLTPREQEFIEARLPESAPVTSDPAFKKEEVIEALKTPSMWSFMLSQFLVNLGGYSLSWYLPTITTSLGFASLPKNQLLNIPPAAASILAIIFSAYFIKRAYITRPAYIMIIMVGMVICFVLFFTISSPAGIYVACILGTMFYSMYFIPFWAWRSTTLKGSTGAAFALGFQNCVGQVGGVIGPQLFQEKWAYNRYKNSFAIAGSSIIAAFFANLWTWWLTRNLEWDVRRIARLRNKAQKEGRVFAEDDIKVLEERQFYSGIKRKDAELEASVV